MSTASVSRKAVAPRSLWSRVQPTFVVLLVLLLLGLPLWMMVVTAGKSQAEALSPNLSLPSDWQLWENMTEIFTRGNITAGFVGSLLIMVPSVLVVLLFGSMAAWVLARRASRAMTVAYGAAISGVVLPPAVVTIVLLLRQIGMSGSAIGMICVYAGIYMSVVVFFVTGFVRTIPVELEEAARVDGAGPVKVFARIILPLLVPVLSTATILICLYVWNDVFYAFFVLSGSLDTLPLNLYNVASAGLYLNNWHLIFAYIILMSLPLLLVFMFMQRKIISGVTSGAVK
ncbi:carbohydrate ABC transporter permease [Cellulomonas timonensis]|uniref:carbohydrate ABC transporter permease n=1 Tax=Cellulomonas timonensis TaxID=1689271 RepID=UPI0008342DDE|nr:carbohydrate ABC transporter permease [Cellulomonas timonensis]